MLASGTARAETPVLEELPRLDPIPLDQRTGSTPAQRILTPREQTISRALTDLASDDIDRRVGAAMLLGKYEEVVARSALAGALADEAVLVRRAAVVSLLEQGGPMPFNEVDDLLPMLHDPDVEIRRQISSNLPLLASVARARGIGLVDDNGQFPPRHLWPLFREAYVDADAIVRRNMIAAYYAIGVPLPDSTWKQLLGDPDTEVRRAVLTLAADQLPSSIFVQTVASLIPSEDLLWNRHLARLLEDFRPADSVSLLKRLAASHDPETAMEARISLYAVLPGNPLEEPLFRQLEQNRLTEEQADRLIRQLYRVDRKAAFTQLGRLKEVPKTGLRATVIQLWLSFHPSFPDTSELLPLIEDDSPRVRERILRFLRARRFNLPQDLPGELVFSEHTDVREAVFQYLNQIPPGEATGVLLDLLTDTHLPIRLRALDELVRRQTPEIRRILLASLDDPNEALQIQAARHLLRTGDAELINVLLDRYQADPYSGLGRFLSQAFGNFPTRSHSQGGDL